MVKNANNQYIKNWLVPACQVYTSIYADLAMQKLLMQHIEFTIRSIKFSAPPYYSVEDWGQLEWQSQGTGGQLLFTLPSEPPITALLQ